MLVLDPTLRLVDLCRRLWPATRSLELQGKAIVLQVTDTVAVRLAVDEKSLDVRIKGPLATRAKTIKPPNEDTKLLAFVNVTIKYWNRGRRI